MVKLGFGKTVLFAILVIQFLTPAVSNAQAGNGDAGRYWVSVEQQKSDYYIVSVGIEAKQPLKISVVKVPDFIDASLIPKQREALPLISTEIKIPISFLDRGTGRMYIEINSTGLFSQTNYIVFELYNGAEGSAIKQYLEQYSRFWAEVESGSTAIRCGGMSIAVDASMAREIDGLPMFSAGKGVAGVLLAGNARDLKGEIDSVDAADWGLGFSTNVSGIAVGSFAEVDFVIAEATVEPQTKTAAVATTTDQQPARVERPVKSEGKEVKVAEAEQTPETTEEPRENDVHTAVEEAEDEAEAKSEPELAAGPYSGVSTISGIGAFSMNWPWSKQRQQDGRFGETSVEMPSEFSRLKQLDKAVLVLRVVYSQRVGNASGRLFVNSFRSVLPKDNAHNKGKFWIGDRRSGRERFLGDFNVSHQGRVLRYDITSWVRSNPSDRYFIVVENLSRADIAVARIHIEIAGQR